MVVIEDDNHGGAAVADLPKDVLLRVGRKVVPRCDSEGCNLPLCVTVLTNLALVCKTWRATVLDHEWELVGSHILA